MRPPCLHLRPKWPPVRCSPFATSMNDAFPRADQIFHIWGHIGIDNPFTVGRRSFAYYRFHKRIGKGNWNRYIERYIKPRSIENTQRIVFNYHASYQAAKASASYLWELPKRIAAATSANGVLDAWIYFRHKRKKAYHYVLALRRLCDMKDVDTSDWRFQFISKNIIKHANYFIDLPGICNYLGKLRAIRTLDRLSLVICENAERYTFAQLATVANAFGRCRLHSKYLFAQLARHCNEKLHVASNKDLILVAKAYGKCMVYNYGLLGSISLEMQKRFSPIPSAPTTSMGEASSRHCIANLIQPKSVQVQLPTMHDVLGLAEAFSVAKHRDLQLFDALSIMARMYIKDPSTNDPFVITRVIRAFVISKVNDVPLFSTVLEDIAKHPYDYPPSCIAEIGKHVSAILPREVDNMSTTFIKCLDAIEKHLSRMTKGQLTYAAEFAYKGHSDPAKKVQFLEQINKEIVRCGFQNDLYDVPKLFEVLSKHKCVTTDCFNILCRDVYHMVSHFEPVDYQRTSRVLRALKRREMTNLPMVNMLSKSVINHHEEFSPYQYHCVIRDLTLAGPPFDSLLTELWSYNRYTKGYRPPQLTTSVSLPADTS